MWTLVVTQHLKNSKNNKNENREDEGSNVEHWESPFSKMIMLVGSLTSLVLIQNSLLSPSCGSKVARSGMFAETRTFWWDKSSQVVFIRFSFLHFPNSLPPLIGLSLKPHYLGPLILQTFQKEHYEELLKYKFTCLPLRLCKAQHNSIWVYLDKNKSYF